MIDNTGKTYRIFLPHLRQVKNKATMIWIDPKKYDTNLVRLELPNMVYSLLAASRKGLLFHLFMEVIYRI